jgi:Fur family transcriptional regulator, iron response regulator
MARLVACLPYGGFVTPRKDASIEMRRAQPYNPCMSDALAPLTETGLHHASDWLSRGGIRPTRQRQMLAALLVGDGCDRHVTAESLFSASQDTGEKVSLATVYNTLKAFCDAGLMQEVTVDGARSYFDTRMDEHPHFYWENTAELVDAPADGLKITGLPTPPDGAVISRVDVVIRLRKA